MRRFLYYVASVLCCFAACVYAQDTQQGDFVHRGNFIRGFPSTGGTPYYLPQLPIFIDGEELACTVTATCSTNPPSPGLGYVAPAYHLTLGTSGGTWYDVSGGGSTAPPAIGSCFTTWNTSGYTNNSAGLQNATNDLEKYRRCSGGVVGFILILTPSSVADNPGCTTGAYCFTSGWQIPQTSASQASSPIIVQPTTESTIAALPEPVCNGGIEDNDPVSTVPGLSNPACNGVGMYYTLGTTVTNVSSCASFTFANGTPCLTYNPSGYNYVQYMARIECTGSDCTPNYFCPVASSPCSGQGPDHWQFNHLAYGLAPGNPSNSFLVQTGGDGQVYPTQFSNHNHWRGVWFYGDWSNLLVGTNQVASGLNGAGCYYCSIQGWSMSQALRPGSEGHVMGIDGATMKIEYGWAEAQSSCIFGGGFSNTPNPLTYTPFTNMQIARIRCGFPQAWLGIGVIPNNNPYWGGATNAPWITTPTMAYISGSTLVYVSGDAFHDSSSAWPNNPIKLTVGISTVGVINAHSTTLSASNNPFATWQVGDTIAVYGAGAGGSTLTTTIASYGGAPNVVQLANPASTSVTGAAVYLTVPYKLAGQSSWTQQCPSLCYTGASSPVVTQIPLLPVAAGGSGPLPCTTFCGSSGAPLPFILGSQGIVRKNCEEFKEGQFVLIYGFLGENVDNSGGQKGACPVITVRQTSGGGLGQNYYSTLNDVTIIDSIFRNTCTGEEIDALSAGSGNGGGSSYVLTRMLLGNILQYNVNGTAFGCGGFNYSTLITSASHQWTGSNSCDSFGNCTFTAGNAANGTTLVTGGSVDAGAPMESDSFTPAPASPIGCNGTTSVTCYAPNTFVVGETVELLGASEVCLNGTNNTSVVTAATSTSFTVKASSGCTGNGTAEPTNALIQGPVGFQVFDLRAADPVFVDGCSTNGLNMPTYSWSSHTLSTGITATAAAATTPWTGQWSSANTTVYYHYAQGAGLSDTSGNCTLWKIQGGPQYLYHDHVGIITTANVPLGEGTPLSSGPTFAFKNKYTNSYFLSVPIPALGMGGVLNGVVSPNQCGTKACSASSPEGNATETYNYDLNTLSFFKNIILRPSGTNAYYAEYGNNTNFLDGNLLPCTPPACVIQPPTGTGMYFPTASCQFGFVGSSTDVPAWDYGADCPSGNNNVPIVTADYHSFALNSSSSYHNAGSDSRDIGPIITGTGYNTSSIDDAFTRTIFNCAMVGQSCPTNKPFPY